MGVEGFQFLRDLGELRGEFLRASEQPQLPLFQRQQLLFDWQATTVAGELAVRPDHAVRLPTSFYHGVNLS